MARYTIKAFEGHTWDAVTNEEVINGFRDYYYYTQTDDTKLLKGVASGFCNWTGKPIRYSSVEDLVADAVKHGAMEVDYAERAR